MVSLFRYDAILACLGCMCVFVCVCVQVGFRVCGAHVCFSRIGPWRDMNGTNLKNPPLLFSLEFRINRVVTSQQQHLNPELNLPYQANKAVTTCPRPLSMSQCNVLWGKSSCEHICIVIVWCVNCHTSGRVWSVRFFLLRMTVWVCACVSVFCCVCVSCITCFMKIWL